MTHAAFFRNLNQGQRASPTHEALVAAFASTGGTGVQLVQGNGTVVFEGDDPLDCVERVRAILAGNSEWDDVVFVRDVNELDHTVGLAPSVGDPRAIEVSFFDESVAITDALPLAGRRCTVVTAGAGFAITVNERPDESNGTSTIERVIGSPVTSRGLNTVRRVLAVIQSGGDS